jgi:fluoroquinolone transport system permease protein
MSTRFLALAMNDFRLQFRYGIHLAYAVVLAMYVGVLIAAGTWQPAVAPGVIIFSDPAALGFFFLGALMLLERAEGVRQALAVAPVSAMQYFLSKAVTLTILALVASAVLVAFVHRPTNPALLLVAVALTSVAYIGIGVPIALRFRTVNAYLIGSAGLLLPVITPGALALLDPTPTWALVLPAAPQLKLMLVATGASVASAMEIAFMVAASAGHAAGAGWLAVRALRRELGK